VLINPNNIKSKLYEQKHIGNHFIKNSLGQLKLDFECFNIVCMSVFETELHFYIQLVILRLVNNRTG
jgi:hypothetical protein